MPDLFTLRSQRPGSTYTSTDDVTAIPFPLKGGDSNVASRDRYNISRETGSVWMKDEKEEQPTSAQILTELIYPYITT